MIDQILAEEKQNFDASQPVVLRIPSMQAPGYWYVIKSSLIMATQ